MKLLLALSLMWTLTANALTADSFIVTNMRGETLLEKNADQLRPIASITKLFVAEQAVKLDPEEKIEITRSDVQAGQMRSTPLRIGRLYSRSQLTELALVSSDNVAAIALGRSAPPETSHANLVESSGLNAANQSTAREIAAAARELYYTDIGRISVRQKTEVGSRNSTNPFLKKDGWRFFLSKTGFINRSGGCLVVVMLVNEVPVTVALLGSASKQRWQDLIKIRRMLGDSDFYTPQRVSSVRRHRHL